MVCAMSFKTHEHMLDNLNTLNTKRRPAQGWQPLSKNELATRAGITRRYLARIYAGDACSEATWDKLIEAVMAK